MTSSSDANTSTERITKRGTPEPETRVGNCSGCGVYPLPLFKIQGIYRYRCADCFEAETGYRHHLSPPAGRILLP